jgi:O-antigen ligase
MSLASSITKISGEPLRIMGALWALALLAPFAPGLPKPAPSGLPWRQELFLALVVSLTLLLLLKKVWRSRASSLSLKPGEAALLCPLALFILWSAASTLWARAPYPALHHTFVWTAYAFFFVLMRRVAERPRALRASLFTLGSVISILSVSCMIEFWGAPNESGVRTISLFRFFNGFGEMLAVAIPLFAALALKLRRGRAALLCGATAVAAWLAMLQALERAPIIGASVALILLALLSLTLRSFRPHTLRRALLLVVAFAFVTALQVVPSPLTRGRSSAVARLQATSASEANTRVRFLFWGIGLEMLREHPLAGVGANNYDAAYPQARALFALSQAGSPLVAMHEEMLVERAHNEYVQMLAELGLVGFALFLFFCGALAVAAWRALRRSRSALAPGACCSLLAFALSSGASSASFRWMGGGLLFFLAAALVSRFSIDSAKKDKTEDVTAASVRPQLIPARLSMATALVIALLMLGGRTMQATNSILLGAAQRGGAPAQVESLYTNALKLNPFDAATHVNYGLWLYYERRAREAVPHLSYAVERGMNSSICYAYLAAAQAGAQDYAAAEATMRQATLVYPRSVFLRVRHATALHAAGDAQGAAGEYAVALSLDARTARGWLELMNTGVDVAKVTAHNDPSVAMPGELYPENCIYAIIAEFELARPEIAAVVAPSR